MVKRLGEVELGEEGETGLSVHLPLVDGLFLMLLRGEYRVSRGLVAVEQVERGGHVAGLAETADGRVGVAQIDGADGAVGENGDDDAELVVLELRIEERHVAEELRGGERKGIDGAERPLLENVESVGLHEDERTAEADALAGRRTRVGERGLARQSAARTVGAVRAVRKVGKVEKREGSGRCAEEKAMVAEETQCGLGGILEGGFEGGGGLRRGEVHDEEGVFRLEQKERADPRHQERGVGQRDFLEFGELALRKGVQDHALLHQNPELETVVAERPVDSHIQNVCN